MDNVRDIKGSSRLVLNQKIRDGIPEAEEEDIVGMTYDEAAAIVAAVILRDKLIRLRTTPLN